MGAACTAQPPASWAEGVLTLGRHGLQQTKPERLRHIQISGQQQCDLRVCPVLHSWGTYTDDAPWRCEMHIPQVSRV